MLKTAIAESCSNCMFHFIRICQAGFQGSGIVFRAYPQRRRGPLSLHPCPHLVPPLFFTLAFLIGVLCKTISRGVKLRFPEALPLNTFGGAIGHPCILFSEVSLNLK